MTSLQELHDHSSQHSSADKCLTRYTLCHILVSEQHSTSSSLLVLFGPESMPTLGSGPKHAYSVSARRLIVTRLLHCLPLQALMLALTTSTSTSLDHFHLLKDVSISSPALIDSRDGQKPYPFPTSPQRLLPVLSSLAGSPALAPPPQFPRTEDVSSSLNSGPN